MSEFFFTFGPNHRTIDSIALRGYWVRVQAPTRNKARKIFREQFAEVYLNDIHDYNIISDSDEFQSKYFPDGEFAFITETEVFI
jgi:hypothetical protein